MKITIGRRATVFGAGCTLVLLLAGLSSAQVKASTITDGRYRAGDIEPGVYMTTQHGCDTDVEFAHDRLPALAADVADRPERPEPPGPRYYYISHDPLVVAYIFTGGCTWTRVRPIPKIPATSP
ncbi:hypothetical protein GCM10029978_107830 [Actinoallomurus acanthiterrae]